LLQLLCLPILWLPDNPELEAAASKCWYHPHQVYHSLQPLHHQQPHSLEPIPKAKAPHKLQLAPATPSQNLKAHPQSKLKGHLTYMYLLCYSTVHTKYKIMCTISYLFIWGNKNCSLQLCQKPNGIMCHPLINLLLQKPPLIHKVHESTHHIKGGAFWAPMGDKYICHPHSTDQQEMKLLRMKYFLHSSQE